LATAPLPLPAPLAEKMLHLDGFEELRRATRSPEMGANFFDRILNSLEVRYRTAAEGMKRIPRQGPVVVVANHPFGLIEGPVLGDAMVKLRPDVKFMANGLLHVIPEMKEWVIGVDPFGGEGARERNLRPMRETLGWLKKGGLLIIFPAGEVSSWRFPQMRIEDPDWNELIVRIVKHSGATVVPVHFEGTNGPLFHAAGFVHPRLRTALLPHEFFQKQGGEIAFQVGSPIPAARLTDFGSDRSAIQYLRRRVYVMEAQHAEQRPKLPIPWPQWRRQPEPLAEPTEAGAISEELDALEAGQHLLDHHEYAVYVARAAQIPSTLKEIGRLREATFREVGEGTGKSRDLDAFDCDYEHLILYHRKNQEIAGGYRLCKTDDALRRTGITSLYTSTLFRCQPEFLERLGPAVELGRSFVGGEYQRSYQPLLLLWKGLGQIILREPKYARLFGPVSISAAYSRTSQELMVSYLLKHRGSADLAPYAKPRHPFKLRAFASQEMLKLATSIREVEELADIVSDAEPGHKGVPVLLRQYLSLGGRIVNFNVDPSFNNCLDGLITVDLRETEPKVLERYMGKEGGAAFLGYHESRYS
jgi:putative hemolysin